ncbi:MAG: alpha/beta fold hydrolase [Planctomycetia bacterium]|nr:alpha/beta fold hydrolase [Planctomycetia bacterium]
MRVVAVVAVSFRFPFFLMLVALWLGPRPLGIWELPCAWAQEPAVKKSAAPIAVEELDLETSDGVRLVASYYRVAEDTKPLATVIVLHDLEGSGKSVEPLATALQEAGCAVIAPDLRGHGASTRRVGANGKEEEIVAKALKKTDLELMAATRGGSMRDQAGVVGDIETVRNYIHRKSLDGELDINRLCLVGCGTGATLAALWTTADAAWPPLANGPQGQQVRALVLVSPVWATKGLSISPALSSDILKRAMPMMVIAEAGNRDATRLFDQLKRGRPQEWWEQRLDQPPDKAPKLEKASDATLFYMELDSTLSGDKLASDSTAGIAGRVKTFLSLVLSRKR